MPNLQCLIKIIRYTKKEENMAHNQKKSQLIKKKRNRWHINRYDQSKHFRVIINMLKDLKKNMNKIKEKMEFFF